MTKLEELKLELANRGLRYVSSRGAVGGPIALVGEAPGADEDREGFAFVGNAGRELDRMLCEANIDATKCWWTNPYQTRPPENRLNRIGELGIPDQVFVDAFLEELHVYKPTFIAALGATALGTLCPFTIPRGKKARAEIGKWQGSLLYSPLLGWPHYVIPALHPAAVLREWSERPVTILCLEKLQTELRWFESMGTLQPVPQRTLIANPSPYDAVDYLHKILNSEEPVAVDIENIGIWKGKYKTPQRGRVPYVIAFSNDPLMGMSIGLAEYDCVIARKIWRLIDVVLRTKRTVWQHGDRHDMPWLRFIGFSPNIQLAEDTLIREHILYPELPRKLEALTMRYTREPYYKDEGEIHSAKDRTKFKTYNARDACVTLEVFYAQEKEFEERCSTSKIPAA